MATHVVRPSEGAEAGTSIAMPVSLDVSAIPARMGGVGRYVSGLLEGLAPRDDCHLTLFTSSGDASRWLDANPHVRIRDRAPRARPQRLLWEQLQLPRELRQAGVAAHHGPHYTMPRYSRIPRVVTIHDMTFITHPEWHEASKRLFFQQAIRLACKEADVLICVSNSTAEKLRDYREPRGQVIVVPHGIDGAIFAPVSSGPEDLEVLTRLEVPRPYVLFLGTVEPRKNVPGLVRAFDQVGEKHRDVTLVIGGGRGWAEAELDAARERSPHASRIRRLGYVADTDVPSLLRNASAVVYPSLDEGFGLPVLEALACGAPTITTRGTAMDEASGGAARLVTPGDIEGLAGAIDETLDCGVSDEQRQLGFEAVSRHTWAASAEKHVQAYRLAASMR
jgi:glycosyltransferase involved in cell wall biosynthesis